MAQLVKANSIEGACRSESDFSLRLATSDPNSWPAGNKRPQATVIYTLHSNLKKTGAMATGSVSFHNDRLVKRIFVGPRDNAVVNRLNKSKVVREVRRPSTCFELRAKPGGAARQCPKMGAEEQCVPSPPPITIKLCSRCPSRRVLYFSRFAHLRLGPQVDHEEERVARQRIEGKLKAAKANELVRVILSCSN